MVEALVGIFLLAVLSLGIYASYSFGLKISIQNRLRTTATAIAERKIETIRAMNYVDMGVEGGVPGGNLLATETEIDNGTTYTIKTSIRYIDDPLDNVFPQDIVPTDYKQIEVRVSWPTNMENSIIKLDTYASPPRVESAVGMGVLMINTVDGSGNPIEGCQVHLVNNSVNPKIDLTEETDSNGSLLLPGAPTTTTNSYEVTISKNGYETVQTYPPYPVSSFNPIDTHISVSSGAITSKVFVIDLTSHQNLHFSDIHGTSLPNMNFSLVGGRVIGTTVAAAPEPVYSYNQSSLNSDSNGMWNSPALGKGPYAFSITNASYELITTSLVSPWSLAANTTLPVEIVMGNKTENILVITVKESGGNVPVVGATVKVSDVTGIPFQETITDANGIAYFPKVEDPPKSFIGGQNYNIEVTSTGYITATTTATASGIVRRTIDLTKQ